MKNNDLFSKPDLSLQEVYYPILLQQMNFKGKVAYALKCICDSISHNNPNHLANLYFIRDNSQVILKASKTHCDINIIEKSLFIFNMLRGIQKSQEISSFINLLLSIDLAGEISDEFIKQCCSLIDKCRMDSQHSVLLAYDILKKYGKLLGQKQTKYLAEFVQRYSGGYISHKNINLNQFDSLSPLKALEMAEQRFHSQMMSVEQLRNIQNKCLNQNPLNMRIIYKCFQLSTLIKNQQKAVLPPFLQNFKERYPKPIQQQYLKQIQYQKIGELFQYILNQQIKNLQLKQLRIKHKNQKQILQILHCMVSKKPIKKQYQQKYCQSISFGYLDDTLAISTKIKSNKNSKQFLHISKKYLMKQIQINRNQVIELCINMHRYYLQNKHYKQLTIVQQIVKTTNISLKDILSHNLQALILIPFIDESQKQEKVTKKIEKLFGQSRFTPQQKSSLCYWGLKNKNYDVLESFIHYFFRSIKITNKIIDEILYYMKEIDFTKIDLEWLYENFSEDLQRILEIIMTLLASNSTQSPIKIIFQLNKIQNFKVFDQWSGIYRWALNPLQNPNFQQPQRILDFLEIFQTLVESHCSVPIKIIQKYCQLIIEHWQKFKHDHIFSIERTLGYLCQGLLDNQKMFEELVRSITKLRNKKESYNKFILSGDALETLLGYVLDHNAQQSQEDLNNEINEVLRKTDIKKLENISLRERQQYLRVIQLFLWRFQYSDVQVDAQIMKKFFQIIVSRQKLRTSWGLSYQALIQNCIEIMATMSHQINILNLPIRNILIEFSNNHKILGYCLDIIQNVIQANPKALKKFDLDQYIQEVLLQIINNQNQDIQNILIDIVDRVCLTEGSAYPPTRYLRSFQEVILAEFRLQNCRYRPKLIELILSILNTLKSSGRSRQINFIGWKYRSNQQIALLMKSGELGKHYQQPRVQIKKQKIQIQQKTATCKKVPQQKYDKPIQRQIQQNNINKSIQTKQKTTQNYQKVVNKCSSNSQLKLSLISPTKQTQKYQQYIQPKLQNKNIGIFSIQSNKNSKYQYGIKNQKVKSKGSPVRRKINKQLETGHHIHTIKQYTTFFDNLLTKISHKDNINEIQQKNYKESLQILTETVCIHPYYCQKVTNLGISPKILYINQFFSHQYTDLLLQFYCQLSRNKDRSLIVLNQKCILQFFLNQLQNSIKSNKNTQRNYKIIQILRLSWSINASKKHVEVGMLPVLIEMVKLRISHVEILNLFNTICIQQEMLKQFNERNIIKCIVWSLQNLGEQQNDVEQIAQWIKFAGKICVNELIRDKIHRSNIHELAFKKLQILENAQKQQNLVHFYANLSFKFSRVNQWLISRQIPLKFRKDIEKYKHQYYKLQQYFKFFYYFSSNSQHAVNHLQEISYPSTLIYFLQDKGYLRSNYSDKSFYKSLGCMVTPQTYKYFMKKATFFLLMEIFEDKRSSLIMEAILSLIKMIQTNQECLQLLNQGFQNTSLVFDSKIKDDQSFQFVLDMYIIIISKFGNVYPKFFSLQFIYRILRKGVYSINIEGKHKMLKFLNVISTKQGIYYGNANCLRVFETVMNYQTSSKQLQTLHEYLKIQKQYPAPKRSNAIQAQRQAQKFPMRFKMMVQISQNPVLQILLNKILENTHTNINMQLVSSCLTYFLAYDIHATRAYNKIGNILLSHDKLQILQISHKIQLLSKIVQSNSVQKLIQLNQNRYVQFLNKTIERLDQNNSLIENYCKILKITHQNQFITHKFISQIVGKLKQRKLNQSTIISNTINMLSKTNTSKIMKGNIKNQMNEGIKVKMYKEDNSISDLILFFIQDLSEINCVIKLGQPVKQKWRFKLSQIHTVSQFTKSQQFSKTIFAQSEGLFSKAPQPERCLCLISTQKQFNICFQSQQQKKQWMDFITIAKNHLKYNS